MDQTRRKITKIAREVNKFTQKMLKLDGIGTAEYDFIHVIRKNPGITQSQVCEILGIDKGAATRRCVNLINKGYLQKVVNPDDKRSYLLYACEKADQLKMSKSFVEAMTYEWLLEDLNENDQKEFVRLLDVIYQKSKKESKENFPHLNALYHLKKEELE